MDIKRPGSEIVSVHAVTEIAVREAKVQMDNITQYRFDNWFDYGAGYSMKDSKLHRTDAKGNEKFSTYLLSRIETRRGQPAHDANQCHVKICKILAEMQVHSKASSRMENISICQTIAERCRPQLARAD